MEEAEAIEKVSLNTDQCSEFFPMSTEKNLHFVILSLARKIQIEQQKDDMILNCIAIYYPSFAKKWRAMPGLFWNNYSRRCSPALLFSLYFSVILSYYVDSCKFQALISSIKEKEIKWLGALFYSTTGSFSIVKKLLEVPT